MLKKIFLPVMGVLLVLGMAFGASAVFAAPTNDATLSPRPDDDPPPADFEFDCPDWFLIAAETIGIDEDTLWESMEDASIAQIAAKHGVSEDQIIAAITAAEEKFTKELVAQGEVSQEEADQWLAYLPEEAKAFLEGTWDEEYFGGEDWYLIAANALGMDEEALWDELDSGKSIADLAEAQGVSLDSIRDALTASDEEFIAQLLADGNLSQEEADEWLNDLRSDVDFFLNESWDLTGVESADWIGISMNELGMDEDDFWAALDEGKSIADLAKENNVALAPVAEKIIAAEQASVQEWVAENLLSQDEADEWLSELDEEVQAFLNQNWDWNEGVDWFTLSAETANADEDALWQALDDGKSIAEFAEEQGVSAETLLKAITTAETNYVNELVADGEISQDEADLWLDGLEEDVQLFLTESW